MKFKLVYIVHGIILALLLFHCIKGFNRFIDYHSYMFSFKESFYKSWETIRYGILFLVLPLIGIMIKNIVGWILLNQYFYFIFCNIFILSESAKLNIDYLFLVSLIFGSTTIGLLSILSLKKSSLEYYQIKRTHVLGFNIISYVIGFSASLLLYYLKNIEYLSL